MSGDPASLTTLISGPIGGVMALTFGAGCVSGYGFAIRTAYKAVKDRLNIVEQNAREDQYRCDAAIAALTTRQRELEDMLLGRRPLGFFNVPEQGIRHEE